MSDLLALRISSQQEEDVTGIFFPTAAKGIDTLVPNTGMTVFERKDGKQFAYSSADTMVIGPEVDFPAQNVTQGVRTKLYIATTRLEVIEALLPSACLVQVDEEYFETQIRPRFKEHVDIVELPEVVIAPIGIRKAIAEKICHLIPTLEGFVKRFHTIHLSWAERQLQLVIDAEKSEGLNAEIVDLNQKHYIPSFQHVRIMMRVKKNQGDQFGQQDLFIATDNPRELRKCFEGLDLQELDDFMILEDLRNGAGIPATAKIFFVRSTGIKLEGGFITKKAFSDDTAEARRESLEEDLKNF